MADQSREQKSNITVSSSQNFAITSTVFSQITANKVKLDAVQKPECDVYFFEFLDNVTKILQLLKLKLRTLK